MTVQRLGMVVLETVVDVEAETLEEAKAAALVEAEVSACEFNWTSADDSPSHWDAPPWVNTVEDAEREVVWECKE